MSLKATLFIFDKEYPLLEFDYSLHQNTDYTGRPNTRVYGGTINVTANATKDDSGIEEAMFSPTQMVEGKIVVYKRDGMQKNFEIKFANTYVAFLNYRFNHQSTENLLMDITFSALIMEIRNSIYESPANLNNPFTKKVVPVTVREEEKEPVKIIDVNGPFDENGNEVKYISPKHQYYYHVILKNYEEGYDLSNIQWSVTYDNDNISTNQNIKTGGTYEDGVLKTTIKVSKGKQTATIYAHIGNPNTNNSTIATYKQVVTFFIGGAGDKESYYGIGPTSNINRGVRTGFDKKLNKKIINNSLYISEHLGYNQVKGEDDIKKNVLSLIPNKDGTQVNIVGHSLGGWNGAHLSDILTKKGYTVNTLITLDPVGEGGGVTTISDIHLLFPSPKAEFWINICTNPENYIVDDLIADLGGQWIPRKNRPQVMHTTKYSHGEAENMFNEILAKKTISASSLLLTSVNKYLDTK